MGKIIGYKCPNCNYNEEFRWGCGFSSFQQKHKKSTQIELNLKKEIQEGKYGNLLKEMSELQSSHELIYDCEEALFQCGNCYNISVENKKQIISGSIGKYHQKILFKLTCTKCKKGSLREVENTCIICPKCKKAFLETTHIGNFD